MPMPKTISTLRGAPATRCIATIPAELLERVDALARPCAGGRAEFIRQALTERVQQLEHKNKRRLALGTQ